MDRETSIPHRPVMFEALLEWLLPVLDVKAPAILLDATLGGGGHARAFLQACGSALRVIGLDRDPACVAAAQAWGQAWGSRVVAIHGDFCDMAVHLARLNVPQADAILLDLGVSSYQLDTPERGFSFMQDGPLDMRMDTTQPLTAYHLVNESAAADLQTILRQFGEERWARRIAQAIVNKRQQQPIARTRVLADLVARSIPRAAWPSHIHPATRTFQALRIAVNRELEALQDALPQAVAALRPGGRLGVLTFHSLEDRMVKRFFQQEAKGCICPPKWPQCVCGRQPALKVLTRKPVAPTAAEVQDNPRSRSAHLRVSEKLGV
ncbi:16S rRNA (cytosine(1402)-N(4))-methyltransferase RsmH [Candidatus Entotheonella palauensis]|uniref:Ribosomal RNA small subunit methyltransferase H n=1 Tax=Candidatus Entotheonella gemina TaxID=1429439 RepID=W4MEZ6_9BACT|nr:16S rRNA (cytosine(1402)-N(4))-methyltransferase RsmH [Candidatus Entotheonella palauensis]ETX08222.1 MAG: 16S rRNA methyltransferase [Candidatus Entotheonella gemina]